MPSVIHHATLAACLGITAILFAAAGYEGTKESQADWTKRVGAEEAKRLGKDLCDGTKHKGLEHLVSPCPYEDGGQIILLLMFASVTLGTAGTIWVTKYYNPSGARPRA